MTKTRKKVSELLECAGWAFLYAKGEHRYYSHTKDRKTASAVCNDKNLLVLSTSTLFEANKTYNTNQVFDILNRKTK